MERKMAPSFFLLQNQPLSTFDFQNPLLSVVKDLHYSFQSGSPDFDLFSNDPVQSFKNNLPRQPSNKTSSDIELDCREHRCQSARRNLTGKMQRTSLKVIFTLFVWTIVLTTSLSSEVAENLTETDDAEFRQGGIAQQLMSSYPAMGNVYGGNTGGYQLMGAGAGANGGGGYVNMLRNLYRPPSFGLTDKVKHWVKSFMNRRQYVKPYYNPTGGLSYAPSEYGAKPMFGNGYKAISIPLRQLQKYYKPYYPTSEGGSPQYMQSAGGSAPGGAASASSFIGYNPSTSGVASNGGLYASESASAGHFTGGSSSVFSSPVDGASALYGAGGPSSSLFSSGSNPFSGGSGPNGGLFGGPGGSSGIYSASDSSNSGLFSGTSGGLYGSSGSPSSGLYHGSSSGGANGPVFGLEGSSSGGLYGSESGNSFFNANSGAGGYGSSASASSLLASLNGGSNGGGYGDLYASGANPSASLYNPSNGDNGRSYANSNNKQPGYGASSSALYISSDDRSSESYPSSKSSKEHSSSFNSDSSRNSHAETSYSVSFQPAQGKSYSAAFESAGFQPVSYSADSGNTQGFQEKSS
ncbi:uncharacterized protein TNCT_37541 [Trichonephila clavata]|uniref:Uncharacterized protein n=1 Tax=Trichonephila clavata TaxID=2740835 RepID=A0A8X6KD90_TRICU|nr:uncharacterized protein TNCT_37541 [Trichonephila clavata]